ncbi:MAG TPA: hypothetical protein VKA83_21545, partial [Methylomirabilota bacterium]|nr:hypothetical protein [Methylomirabilota bacterium]
MPGRFRAASGWSFAAAYALGWLPAAALGLYLKHGFMQKEYLVIARSLGRDVAADITVWEALSFYRTDVLLFLVVIPLALVLGLRLIRERYRAVAVLSVSTLFAVFFFVNLQTLGNVGRYMSAGLLFDTVRWGLGHPAFMNDYLPPLALAKLAAVLVAIAALSFLATVRSPRWPVLGRVGAVMPIGLGAVLGLAVVAEALALLPRIP